MSDQIYLCDFPFLKRISDADNHHSKKAGG